MIHYPDFAIKQWQLGSGPTEAACKTTTHCVKGRGRRWNRHAIDAHLAVNSLHTNSGQWNTYWPKTSVP